MSKRFTLASLFASALAMLLFMGDVQAQDYRGDTNLHARLGVGLNSYWGDRDGNDRNEIGRAVDYLGLTGYAELGVHLSPQFTLGFYYLPGNYPRVNEIWDPETGQLYPAQFAESGFDPGANPPVTVNPNGLNREETSEWKHTLGLVARYNFNDNAFSPYIQGMFGGSFGEYNGANEFSFIPKIGIGFDYALSEKLGFFLEYNAGLWLDDYAMDGLDDDTYDQYPANTEPDSDNDFAYYLMTGLRFKLSTKCKAVEISSVSATTSSILEGESVTFTAVVNEMDATDPTTYTWDFGDGNTGMGTTVTHTYDAPGTYTATFTATNCGGTFMETVAPAITVAERPFLELISIAANPMNPEVGQSVNFTSNFRGTQPITCLWEFGDGSTSTNCNPAHTYSQPGTYTAKLTISNAAGERSRELTINVRAIVPVCDIVELNSVFFDRNSSVLTPEARTLLMENVEVLGPCPNTCVRIEGMASAGERRPQQLSEDRARAVEQFYIDNGIAASRLTMMGLGRVGMGSKKEGTAQYRRVDSIPMNCDGSMDMDN